MTPEEYVKKCNQMGYNPLDAGEKLGVVRRTAYRWIKGTTHISETAARTLSYFARNKIPLEELEK